MHAYQSHWWILSNEASWPTVPINFNRWMPVDSLRNRAGQSNRYNHQYIPYARVISTRFLGKISQRRAVRYRSSAGGAHSSTQTHGLESCHGPGFFTFSLILVFYQLQPNLSTVRFIRTVIGRFHFYSCIGSLVITKVRFTTNINRNGG